MTEASGWFDNLGAGAPSAAFKTKGDTVSGTVDDIYTIDYVPFGKTEVAVDTKTGETIKQLVVVLQTEQRNWDGVSKIPTVSAEDKTPKDPSEDDGRRAIYLRKFTNIHAAVGKAVKGAGAETVEKGGKLAVRFYDDEDTGKGNPLKKFQAKYEAAPNTPDNFFEDKAGNDVATDEPPF